MIKQIDTPSDNIEISFEEFKIEDENVGYTETACKIDSVVIDEIDYTDDFHNWGMLEDDFHKHLKKRLRELTSQYEFGKQTLTDINEILEAE